MIDRNKIIEILKAEGYPEFMHESTVDKILHFQNDIANAFSHWVSTNESPNITIEGYTYSFFIEEMQMKPIGAFITLDWLLRDPQKAINALKQGIK